MFRYFAAAHLFAMGVAPMLSGGHLVALLMAWSIVGGLIIISSQSEE